MKSFDTLSGAAWMQLGGALLLSSLLLATGLPVQAATTTGSGKTATETRKVGDFQAIKLRGSIDVVVRQSGAEAVSVSADDNILPLVQTLVEGSGDSRTLLIQVKPGESLRSHAKIVVTVDVVKLAAVGSSGSGDIRIEALKTPALALALSGSSDADLRQLDTERLAISISGSGDVQATGRAAQLDISIAGSGDVQSRSLAADTVKISIAGSGDASVAANKSISVSIAGSGDVEYVGAGILAQSRIAGSGSIRQRQP